MEYMVITSRILLKKDEDVSCDDMPLQDKVNTALKAGALLQGGIGYNSNKRFYFQAILTPSQVKKD